jgi:hypothetical protein
MVSLEWEWKRREEKKRKAFVGVTLYFKMSYY